MNHKWWYRAGYNTVRWMDILWYNWYVMSADMNDDASKPADNPWVVYAGTNQDPALVCPWNLPSPNIPWISGRITEQNVLLKRGCWLLVKACKTLDIVYWGKIYSSEKREWWWGCVGCWGWGGDHWGCAGVRAAGFVARASRPTHRWLITTHNAKHTLYNTIETATPNWYNQDIMCLE